MTFGCMFDLELAGKYDNGLACRSTQASFFVFGGGWCAARLAESSSHGAELAWLASHAEGRAPQWTTSSQIPSDAYGLLQVFGKSPGCRPRDRSGTNSAASTQRWSELTNLPSQPQLMSHVPACHCLSVNSFSCWPHQAFLALPVMHLKNDLVLQAANIDRDA